MAKKDGKLTGFVRPLIMRISLSPCLPLLFSPLCRFPFRLASYVGGESRWFPLAVKFDSDFGNYGNFAVPSLGLE